MSAKLPSTPKHNSYDVIIVGGAMYGAAVSWWLTKIGFDGRVLVVERDPNYEFASTSHTNSCIRQQYSQEINVKISQYGAEFIKNFREEIGDPEAPALALQSFGYMYLASTPAFADALRAAHAVQSAMGAATEHMSRKQIAAAYPFYNLEDILVGNHNLVDEGYFDGGTMFDWFRRAGRANGIEYIANEVTGMTVDNAKVQSIHLESGEKIACGQVVNASGPRAALTAQMAGIRLPVEPRKRFTFIFAAEKPLSQDLPLTIDPSGVHMRTDGRYYMAGCPPYQDPAAPFDDFTMDHSIWEEKVWPAIAHRIPQFEAIKLINSWAGHYAYNTFDQNAIVGPHPEITNFHFVNGFSGHGLQQAPAIGRGMAEYLAYGEYRSMDLTPFAFERIANNASLLEKAVI